MKIPGSQQIYHSQVFNIADRFFIILFGDSPHTAARAVNFMSAIASGLAEADTYPVQ